MQLQQRDTFVSIILTTHNQAEQTHRYVAQLVPFLHARFSDFEVLIIDRASTDSTARIAENALNDLPSVRYLRLTKVETLDVAIGAGLDNAIGDFVLHLQADRDPLTLIDTLISQGENGAHLVIGTSTQVTTKPYRLLRRISKSVIHAAAGETLPANSTGSFLLSRQAVNTITASSRYYWTLYVTLTNSGYPVQAQDYLFTSSQRPKRIIDGIRESLHYLIFNSTKPLRWMSLLGIFGSVMAFVFALYSVLVNMVLDKVVEGWTTTILFMSFLFAILFTMLSFFGEYLARLLDDRSDHASYQVLYEKHSSVMLDVARQNVTFEAEKH